MPDQESLTGLPAATVFDPTKHGFWRRFTDSEGRVIHGMWVKAVAEKAFVGTCRKCGQNVIPSPPDVISAKRTDYEAVCTNPLVSTGEGRDRKVSGCGAVMTAPNGETRSGGALWNRDRSRPSNMGRKTGGAV